MPHAFNIRLEDPSVHAYAQKYCFLNGPDPVLNAQLREAVLASKRALPEERDASRIQLLSAAAQREIERELLETLQIPAALGVDARTRRAFEDARLPNVEAALGIEFHAGDFNALLAANEGKFDVVFSNHVLEHLFDPDRTLKLTRRALSPRGQMIAALPLDGQPRAPFSSVLDAARLHPLDLCTVDVAHAWKTNVSAILRALDDAGFSRAEFSTRDRRYSVAERQFRSWSAFERRAKLGLLLNRAVFASVRGGLKRIFPRQVPPLVLKGVFGIEHRVWFGSNRLKNEFSIECLVVAS